MAASAVAHLQSGRRRGPYLDEIGDFPGQAPVHAIGAHGIFDPGPDGGSHPQTHLLALLHMGLN